MDNQLFEQSVRRIKKQYKELDFTLGWRFLYSPTKTLSSDTRLALVGLNPGGTIYHVAASVEEGNTYRVETLRSADLQRQVKWLFEDIAEKLTKQPIDDVDTLMDKTLTSNFCPFRSPNWNELPNKKLAIQFSNSLWQDIWSEVRPRVVICMGKEPFKYFKRIFIEQDFRVQPEESVEMNPCWEPQRLTAELLRHESQELLLVYFPHFSRFPIMRRRESEPAVDQITTIIARQLDG